MAETTEPNAGTAASTESNVTTVRSTVDVLDANGNDLRTGDNPLADIFNKIEQGSSAKDAIKEVMEKPKADASKPEDAAATKPDAKPPVDDGEQKEEQKPVDDGRDDMFSQDAKAKEEASKKDEADKKAAAAKEAEEKAKEETVTEEELTVLPHDKPKTAKRIKALLAKVESVNSREAETKKELDAKAAKLAELEAELQKVKSIDPTQNEEIKKQLEELKIYRRRYDLEKDPEVKQKFDSRVESAEKSIRETLTKHSAGEALIKIIDSEGGWLKFSDSQREIPLADGNVMKAYELAEAIKKSLPFSDRRAVESLEIEQVATRRERERFFQEQSQQAAAYFEKLEKEQKEKAEAQSRAADDGRKLIETWRDKVIRDNDWLHPKPIPAGATPEQKTAIEEENKYSAQLVGMINKHLSANKLDDMLEIVMDSVRYHQERRQAASILDAKKRLEAQLAEKQAELDRFKKASSTVPRSGSLVGGGSAAATAQKPKAPVSLEDALELVAQGKSPLGDE